MKEKKEYSNTYPLLPKEFDQLEEYVYSGVLTLYDNVSKKMKENKEDAIIMKKAFKEVVEFPNAMEILEKNHIIDKEFIEGAHLYIEDRLKFDPELKDQLKLMSKDFINDFYTYAIKIFFDRYYDIYRACPICSDVKKDMIFNEEDKQWYCPDCFKNK